MRRWRRRLLVATLLAGVAVLAIPATLRSALERRGTMLRLLALATLVVALVAVAGGTLATASSAQAPSLSLVAVDISKSERFVDAGAKGDSPGDTIFFRETLRERGRTVGGSEVMCVFVTRNIGRCHGTLRLGRGTLEASGGVHFGGTFSLPVVGGTGTYAGTAGVLRVTAVDDRRSSYQIDLQS